ncbi:MAG: class I SAM-dependent methyltransferase [Polyangiaceae bacterium]|nr:class I SAM-dependent methyltransferase [Polyangiaceae bacterium]
MFLNPAERLDPDAERAHYLTHQNDPTDARYRAFLDRLAIPLIEKVPPGAKGLDIGSGPGPTLSVMLEERGFDMTVYDPYFAPDAAALQRTYDFITATETVEHFCCPGREFARLYDLLRPNAILGIMTEMVTGERRFDEWHYPRDPTHVSFYRKSTMEWIASHFGFDAEFPRRNVVLFRRNARAGLKPRATR